MKIAVKLWFRRKPKPNATVGGKPVHFDFAQSAHDLRIKCGGCGEVMTVQGDDVVCVCGNSENAADLFHDVSIVGPFRGYELTLWPRATPN